MAILRSLAMITEDALLAAVLAGRATVRHDNVYVLIKSSQAK